MFDFHRHLNKDKKLCNALYNTTSSLEWDKKAKYLSIGLLANNIEEDIDFYLNKMEELLIINPKLHIGEIGLDNRFINLDDQIYFLKKSLDLAYRYNRILSIHIVNLNNILLEILEEHKKRLPNYIIYHGFNKSIELASQLKKYNCIVSINPKVLKTKLFKNIVELDKIGFLIESDWDKETDIGYEEYLFSFISILEEKKLANFKDKNNEFRTILENF